MRFIKNDSLDAAFNLAVEEYLLLNETEPVFMLWRNSRAVIIGKNQNTAAEVNRAFCEENGISVIRRLTGGGAVFHDLGNLNYTIIEKNSEEKFNNYRLFTSVIIDFLKTYGLNAALSGRNDVLLDGKKIIGNAQCVKNGKIMHHGCILYSADMTSLAGALKVSKAKIESKGIKSVSSRVTNIADHIKNAPDIEEFIIALEKFAQVKYNCKVTTLSENEKVEISRIADAKYRTFEWNYGLSPDYSFKNGARFPFGTVDVAFNVTDGKMRDVKISGDFFGVRDIAGLQDALCGINHDRESVESVFDRFLIDEFIKGCCAADLIKIIF